MKPQMLHLSALSSPENLVKDEGMQKTLLRSTWQVAGQNKL